MPSLPAIESIGIIRTPFETIEKMPVQPQGGAGIIGSVIIDQRYQEGLADLQGFSHLYLIYHFHKCRRTEMRVIPFLDRLARGVFATRSPLRPNHIGLSIVELVSVDEAVITVRNVDILDGTPLLDVKPYIVEFDRVENSSSGWMCADSSRIEGCRSDKRFM